MLERGESLFAARTIAESIYPDGRRMSSYVPKDPGVRDLWGKLRRRRQFTDYKQQKESLEVLNKQNSVEVFVATYMIIERKDGLEYSACVWTNGVDSLLPKTETIILLVDADNKIRISLPWTSAFSVIGTMMEKHQTLLPARYRVGSFPNPEQLEELRHLVTG